MSSSGRPRRGGPCAAARGARRTRGGQLAGGGEFGQAVAGGRRPRRLAGVLDLFGGGEERHPADLLEVHAHRVGRAAAATGDCATRSTRRRAAADRAGRTPPSSGPPLEVAGGVGRVAGLVQLGFDRWRRRPGRSRRGRQPPAPTRRARCPGRRGARWWPSMNSGVSPWCGRRTTSSTVSTPRTGGGEAAPQVLGTPPGVARRRGVGHPLPRPLTRRVPTRPRPLPRRRIGWPARPASSRRRFEPSPPRPGSAAGAGAGAGPRPRPAQRPGAEWHGPARPARRRASSVAPRPPPPGDSRSATPGSAASMAPEHGRVRHQGAKRRRVQVAREELSADPRLDALPPVHDVAQHLELGAISLVDRGGAARRAPRAQRGAAAVVGPLRGWSGPSEDLPQLLRSHAVLPATSITYWSRTSSLGCSRITSMGLRGGGLVPRLSRCRHRRARHTPTSRCAAGAQLLCSAARPRHSRRGGPRAAKRRPSRSSASTRASWCATST